MVSVAFADGVILFVGAILVAVRIASDITGEVSLGTTRLDGMAVDSNTGTSVVDVGVGLLGTGVGTGVARAAICRFILFDM